MFVAFARVFILVLACFALLRAPPAAAAPGFAPGKFAAFSIDARTGKALYARNADSRRYPASLTKVMTLYLAFDALRSGRLHMGDRIVVSRHAAAQPPSKIGLRPGSSLTVREALNLIIVKSANDVAVALAEKIGGSEPRFVRRMNAEARRLGMRHTHFANASGLPNRHNVSTARDLVVLARAMIRNHPRRYALFDQTRTTFHGRIVHGHNRLLSRPGVDGLKTGYIQASGFNLITSGVRHGRRVIAVVLGGSTAAVRDHFMLRLMRTSFSRLPSLRGGRLLQAANRTRHPEASDETPVKVAANSRWRIQVGAFSTQAAGSARLEQVAQEHPKVFDEDDGRVKAAANGLYVVRFAADSEADAEQACAVLDRAGEDCLALVRQPD